jgi:hypothetical protein
MFGMGQAPSGYQGTVTHVGLLYLLAWLDAYQLGKQTI